MNARAVECDDSCTHNLLSIRPNLVIKLQQLKLEMWDNAQRDGRPAEYR